VAWLVDTPPLWFLALPLGVLTLMTTGFLAVERIGGLAMFDPSRGGDPILETAVCSATGGRWMWIVFAWLSVEAIALAGWGTTVGKRVAGIRLGGPSGDRPRVRAVVRELPRLALIAAIPAVPALLARASTLALLTWIDACSVVALGAALAHAWRILRDPKSRTLGDLVAGTQVARDDHAI
jgi:hypothetical protein